MAIKYNNNNNNNNLSNKNDLSHKTGFEMCNFQKLKCARIRFGSKMDKMESYQLLEAALSIISYCDSNPNNDSSSSENIERENKESGRRYCNLESLIINGEELDLPLHSIYRTIDNSIKFNHCLTNLEINYQSRSESPLLTMTEALYSMNMINNDNDDGNDDDDTIDINMKQSITQFNATIVDIDRRIVIVDDNSHIQNKNENFDIYGLNLVEMMKILSKWYENGKMNVKLKFCIENDLNCPYQILLCLLKQLANNNTSKYEANKEQLIHEYFEKVSFFVDKKDTLYHFSFYDNGIQIKLQFFESPKMISMGEWCVICQLLIDIRGKSL